MRIKLIVAEPWDFTSPDGKNLLLGEANLENRGISKYGEWLIVRCTLFLVDHHSVTSLLLSMRHKKGQLLGDLISGKMVAVNAYWYKSGLVWNPTLVSTVERDPKMIGGFLIADIERVV